LAGDVFSVMSSAPAVQSLQRRVEQVCFRWSRSASEHGRFLRLCWRAPCIILLIHERLSAVLISRSTCSARPRQTSGDSMRKGRAAAEIIHQKERNGMNQSVQLPGLTPTLKMTPTLKIIPDGSGIEPYLMKN
jgi:hypothetical protein